MTKTEGTLNRDPFFEAGQELLACCHLASSDQVGIHLADLRLLQLALPGGGIFDALAMFVIDSLELEVKSVTAPSGDFVTFPSPSLPQPRENDF